MEGKMAMISKHIDSFIIHCEKERQLTQHSIKGYSIDLRMFLEFLDASPRVMTIKQISKHVLDDYVAHISSKYKVKTIKRKIACLRSFFTYLEDKEEIDENPFRKFRLRLKEGYRAPTTLTILEMERFLSAVYNDCFVAQSLNRLELLKNMKCPQIKTLNGEFFWCRDVAVIELLFASGLRVAELCKLQFEDYDEIEHSLYIILDFLDY